MIIPTPLTPYVFWIKVAGIALIVATLFGTGYKVRGWQDAGTIADLKLAKANQIAVDSQASLADMVAAGKQIKAAADAYTSMQDKLTPKIDQIRKDFKNAPKLPSDCTIDVVRSNAVANAISTGNASRQ